MTAPRKSARVIELPRRSPAIDRPGWSFSSGPALVLYVAAALFLLLIAFARQYGYFRDELYYLACSEHLAFGYVDQPPLIAVTAWFARHAFGQGLIGLRLLPALAGAGTAILAGTFARKMGGGRFAQFLAAMAAALCPVYLSLFHILTMNAFDPLLWMACAYLVLRIQETGNQKLWLLFGAVLGVGLGNKYAIVFFAISLTIAVLLTPLRRSFREKWIWLGALIAAVIALPNVLWQASHGFPFLELMRNIRQSGRDVVLGPLGFLGQQFMMIGPVTALLVVAALWFFFFHREGSRFRVLGLAYVVVVIIFILLHGKNYYTAPAYPMVFAAGAVGLERLTTARLRWLRAAFAVLLIASGLLFMPMALPVLSPEDYIAYTQRLHLVPPASEHQQNGPLENQLYADMFGWDEMARNVAIAYHSLPPEQRDITAIVANGYGQGGAIDFFGPKYDLPKSIGVHQNYWIWGPRNYTLRSLLVMGDDYETLASKCGKVTRLGRVQHPLSRRDEHWDILLCENDSDVPLKEIWPKLKKWD